MTERDNEMEQLKKEQDLGQAQELDHDLDHDADEKSTPDSGTDGIKDNKEDDSGKKKERTGEKKKDKDRKDKDRKKNKKKKKDRAARGKESKSLEDDRFAPQSFADLERGNEPNEELDQVDPSEDGRFTTEMLLEDEREKGKKSVSERKTQKNPEKDGDDFEKPGFFDMTAEEKIDSEFPAEIDRILEVTEKDTLAEHLAYLQRRFRDKKIPVMIILEGAYASGKGRIANELLLGLDARYTNFIATRPPSEDELLKPFLTQYMQTIPDRKSFNIYYRSWYSLYNYYKNRDASHRYKNPEILLNEIRAFEKTLAEDGYVIIKFKLKIDREKQQEHIENMMADPLTVWKAQEFDRDNDETYVKEMERAMKVTDEPHAPWYMVDYTKKSDTTVEVMKKVIRILDNRLKEEEAKPEPRPEDRDGLFTGISEGPLSEVDLDREVSNEEYSDSLKKLQDQMRQIQHGLYIDRIPLILVFEGWDAGGKGGSIHRIITNLDPTHYTVHTTGAPTDEELSHHYLWRFAKNIPRAGHIGIWDRSWYGRLMVERIEGFATNREWAQAYAEINHFEKLMTNYGAIVLKFFIHIDKDTQLKRFESRQNTPSKNWKITDEDWRNRDKWEQYEEAINEMIEKTSTENAPWHIIEGNSKKFARLKILKLIIDTCDERLQSTDINSGDKEKDSKKQEA